MKRWLICAGLFMTILSEASAQKQQKRTGAKTQITNKQTATKKAQSTTTTNRLESTSANAAKAPAIPQSGLGWMNTPVYGSNYQIADPVVRTLNQRANGAPAPMDFKEFMGVGRGTYGVANGRILLRPNGSTTSGGITGSGAVGTGSSPGGAGIHGTVNTVNGKNPYAGPGMWGTTGTGIGTNYRMTEGSSKSIRVVKEQ